MDSTRRLSQFPAPFCALKRSPTAPIGGSMPFQPLCIEPLGTQRQRPAKRESTRCAPVSNCRGGLTLRSADWGPRAQDLVGKHPHCTDGINDALIGSEAEKHGDHAGVAASSCQTERGSASLHGTVSNTSRAPCWAACSASKKLMAAHQKAVRW